MKASEFRANTAEVLNRVAYGGERIVLERHGKPAAVLIPLADLDLLIAMEDRVDGKEAAKAKRGKAIPLAKARKKLGLG